MFGKIGYFLCAFLFVGLCLGESKADAKLPGPLEPWKDWVLGDEQEPFCPQIGKIEKCVWPGRLDMATTEKGGFFTFEVFVNKKSSVLLPGNTEHWPQAVRINGYKALLSQKDGKPSIEVSPGKYLIQGQFEWDSPPEMVLFPSDVGRISLVVAGRRIEYPRIDGNKLFLGERERETAEEDSLRVSVHRSIEDNIPLTIKTRVELKVSGTAREVDLGKVLIEGSQPVEIKTPLPTQVSTEGDVKIYVRPGSYVLQIDALMDEEVGSLKVPEQSMSFYDPQETWAWVPNETLRSVELRGLSSVDPARTSLPADWQSGQMYLAEQGDELTLQTTRRGVVESPPNLINLKRELWLDLDGSGYTVRDHITGTMHQGWRLNTSSGGSSLGRVSSYLQGGDPSGGSENLLITTDINTNQTGIELREVNLDLVAEHRMEREDSDLGIVGWDHDVHSLEVNLNLPPGWTLVGGEGIDRMTGTWLSSWNMGHFFFVLMVSLIVGKIYSWYWTPVVMLMLALTHGHEEAPHWIWVYLLITLALLRAVPHGSWRNGIVIFRGVLLLNLILTVVPFVLNDLRQARYPQLAQMGYFEESSEYSAKRSYSVPSREVEMLDDVVEKNYLLEEESSIRKRNKVMLQQVDPNAVVQTGPGLPNWTWGSWSLEWTGPVRSDHRIQLWLISPTGNFVLALVRVLLTVLISLLMIAPAQMYFKNPFVLSAFWKRFSGSAFLLLGFFSLGSVQPVYANEIPSPQLLQELKYRQLKAKQAQDPTCPDPCITVSKADISVWKNSFYMAEEVHALREVGVPLPGTQGALYLDRVWLNGVPTNQLRRETNGLVYVRVPQGVHELRMEGRLPNQNVVNIQFDESARPLRTYLDTGGWDVDGFVNGEIKGSLQFSREQKKANSGMKETLAQVEALPSWFYVTRSLELGMPWTVYTEIKRSDFSRSQMMSLPLIDGEKVLDERIRVEDGRALIDFPREQSLVSYRSELSVSDRMILKAEEGVSYSETWFVKCSRIWSCTTSELPALTYKDDMAQQHEMQFKPWPGEALKIDIKKPMGAEGSPTTIDKLRYSVSPGIRLLQATVEMTIRASQGGWKELTLPKEAELQSVFINSTEQNIRPKGDIVSIPIKSGNQDIVLRWQQPWKRSLVEQMPEIKIDGQAVNGHLEIKLGSGRWLIWTTGPSWGPAILFWPHLVAMLLFSALLGRLKFLPVKTHEWILLSIGMSQLPFAALFCIVLWFVILTWRQSKPLFQKTNFNLLQLFIVLMTCLVIGILYAAVHSNLLFDVDMQVKGTDSNNSSLKWYTDRFDQTPPTASVMSLPIWIWRVVMLSWSFWLVSALLKWGPWAWDAFSSEGFWKRKETPESDSEREEDMDSNEQEGGLESEKETAEQGSKDEQTLLAFDSEQPQDPSEDVDGHQTDDARSDDEPE